MPLVLRAQQCNVLEPSVVVVMSAGHPHKCVLTATPPVTSDVRGTRCENPPEPRTTLCFGTLDDVLDDEKAIML
ncbi:pb-fam-2 protein [Culex quinquefasciatus]|uniref:Pb-fam-2 protein n=1 Tax=Culex quinquefasciatus TaxID=7176 RepID=B0WR03_CULQU|nr:pb-fam-2 protein [Culex quinquefasciatus]|eukprot:XP_001851137.1 pb-fam-2 protein [Culex quinquefasciatus]